MRSRGQKHEKMDRARRQARMYQIVFLFITVVILLSMILSLVK